MARKPGRIDDKLAHVVKDSLRRGDAVKLEGLGVLRPRANSGIDFVPDLGARVFIAYVTEEFEAASRLYDGLLAAGLSPWLDRRKLLPGQEWGPCIDRAIENADFFVPCFSKRALSKKGQFPYEVRLALRCADRMPLEDVYILPVRLDECIVPRPISGLIHYVDLFPDWDRGLQQVIDSMLLETDRRRLRRPAA